MHEESACSSPGLDGGTGQRGCQNWGCCHWVVVRWAVADTRMIRERVSLSGWMRSLSFDLWRVGVE